VTTPAPDGHRPGRVTISVPTWVAALRDPGIQAVIVLVVLAVIGFVMFALAWRGGARTPYEPLQVPWLVSGGIAGLALLGMALGSWSIHLGRRDDAAHRAEVDDLVREAAALAEDVRSGRGQLPGR
jgi:protein-S-isoprenylcysteine O-methyltransferase Ste14